MLGTDRSAGVGDEDVEPVADLVMSHSTATPPISSANRSMSSGSVTSQVTARPPICAASSSMRSVRRAAQITSNPSAASRRAVARPMPLLAPVTTASRLSTMGTG